MATLTVTASHVYSFESLGPNPIDHVAFSTSGFSRATFSDTQFGSGNGLISNKVLITGDSHQNEISVGVHGTFSAAGWQFANWSPASNILSGDYVELHSLSNDSVTITGSSQNDLITSGSGADHLNGGDGDDRFDALFTSAVGAGETINGGNGTDTLRLFGTNDLSLAGTSITNVEILNLGLEGTSVTTSGSQFGGTGDFTTVSGNINDTQTLIVNGSSVDLSGVTFTGWGGADQTININGTSALLNMLSGSNQRDTITGTGAADVICGRDGADVMNGGGGADFFYYFAPGEADSGEIISGDAGSDTIKLSDASSIDFSLATITSVETLDYESGDSSATFLGTQIGTGAIAAVSGSSGRDVLIVKGAAFVDVDLSGVSFTSWTNGTDAITINGSVTSNTLIGSNQNDTINGLGGADTLIGGGGNDILNGGTSNDTMSGGANDDSFVFTTALSAGNIDSMTDFNDADDTVVLDHLIFTGLAAGALSPDQFFVGTAAHQLSDRIIYDQTTGALFFDADGDLGGAAIQFATNVVHGSMSNVDFLVI